MTMEFSPQKFREIVFQLLYSLDVSGSAEEELIPFLMRELAVSKKHVSAAFKKAEKIWGQRSLLDPIIGKNSQEYSFGRIKTVEKNVLRLALYELLIEKERNRKIIISEAHRLARKFSTVEGASFVNALLDSLEIENGSTLPTPERETAQ
jgi:transcription antitermination protein NusB